MDLSAVLQSNDDNEKLALDVFMIQFSVSFFAKLKISETLAGNIPQHGDTDIVHLYLDNAEVRLTFSMDYAGEIG